MSAWLLGETDVPGRLCFIYPMNSASLCDTYSSEQQYFLDSYCVPSVLLDRNTPLIVRVFPEAATTPLFQTRRLRHRSIQ